MGREGLTAEPAEVVIDASIVIAAIKGEVGHERAWDAADGSIISSVNLAEVAAWLADEGKSPSEIEAALSLLNLEVAPFDPDRSPWDATLIQGIEGGRAALFVRGHHVLTDGRGGVSLIELLLDEGPAKSRTSSGRSERWAGNGVGRDRPDRTRSNATNIDLANVLRPVTSTVTTALSEGPFKALARGTQQTLDLASSMAVHASDMYARNILTFASHLLAQANGLDLNDEITRGSLVTHKGEIVHDAVKAALARSGT